MGTSESLLDAALAVHRAGQGGQFSASEVVRARCSEHSDPGSRALSAALEAQQWQADPSRGQLVHLESLASLQTTSAWERSAVALAVGEVSRVAVLAWDMDALRRAQALVSPLVEQGVLPELEVAHTLREAWVALFEGDSQKVAQLSASSADAAARIAGPAAVIESTVLSALAYSLGGDLTEATRVARLGSRMARTEAFPQFEYLANVTLARIRRLTGRSHLSVRILQALHSIAPAPWHAWIAWELLLSGAPARADEVELAAPLLMGSIVDAARPSSHALRESLRTAAAGDRRGFRGSMDAATVLVGSVSPFAEDLASVCVAVDPEMPLPPSGFGDVVAWCRGETSAPPPRLRGVMADLGAGTAREASAAWVVAGPGVQARRLVAIGGQLSEATHRLIPSKKAGRVETLIAALALAEEGGLTLSALFRLVYGFDYDPIVHRNLFNVLVHRARTVVAKAGEIQRDDDTLRLSLRASLLVPDPRCEQPLEELVLRVLAREGRANAKSAAKALSTPLRTVQDALRQLADEGAVQLSKDGQGFQYHVEDTTFSEPTRSGS